MKTESIKALVLHGIFSNRCLQLTIAAVAIALFSHAQTTISPMLFCAAAHDTVINTGGENYSISWSLGEIAIESISSPGNPQFTITQGYHQPNYGGILSTENEWNEVQNWADISVFPNPTPGEVQVTISQTQNSQVEMQVYSLQGQLILRKYYSGDKISDSIDLSHLRAGTYLLMFSKTGLASHTKTFKLIKIH